MAEMLDLHVKQHVSCNSLMISQKIVEELIHSQLCTNILFVKEVLRINISDDPSLLSPSSILDLSPATCLPLFLLFLGFTPLSPPPEYASAQQNPMTADINVQVAMCSSDTTDTVYSVQNGAI